MKTRRIGFVLPDGMGLGGVTTWSLETAAALAGNGTEVTLIEHVKPGAPAVPRLAPGAGRIQLRGRLPAFAALEDVRRYRRAYRRALPAVLIPNFAVGTYAACAALSSERASDLRVIGFAHADEPYYYDLLGYYEPIIHRFAAVSQEVATTLRGLLPNRQTDIFVRPYGVSAPEALARTYSRAPYPLRLVYAGRLVEKQKRVTDLVALAEALGRRAVDFHLDIIGEGDAAADLGARISALDGAIRQRVRLVARVPHHEMAGVWRTADVCVLVSEYEGISIAMLEAMAQGCVPVVTRVSGAAEALRPGQNGYTVEVGDIVSMAETIAALDRERSRLAGLGARAHETVKASFSDHHYAAWLLEQCGTVWDLAPRAWPANRPLLPIRPRGARRSIIGRVLRSRLAMLGRRTLKATPLYSLLRGARHSSESERASR